MSIALKILGGLLAGAGGLTAAFSALLAFMLVAFYVEWDNAVDALRTVFFITVPMGLAGLVLLWGGRLIMRRAN